jgi:hypothetical protein
MIAEWWWSSSVINWVKGLGFTGKVVLANLFTRKVEERAFFNRKEWFAISGLNKTNLFGYL